MNFEIKWRFFTLPFLRSSACGALSSLNLLVLFCSRRPSEVAWQQFNKNVPGFSAYFLFSVDRTSRFEPSCCCRWRPTPWGDILLCRLPQHDLWLISSVVSRDIMIDRKKHRTKIHHRDDSILQVLNQIYVVASRFDHTEKNAPTKLVILTSMETLVSKKDENAFRVFRWGPLERKFSILPAVRL